MDLPKEYQKSLTTRFVDRRGIELYSLCTVVINNWMVRASITVFDTVLVVMTHKHLGFTKVSFFTDETKAHDYIHSIVNQY